MQCSLASQVAQTLFNILIKKSLFTSFTERVLSRSRAMSRSEGEAFGMLEVNARSPVLLEGAADLGALSGPFPDGALAMRLVLGADAP